MNFSEQIHVEIKERRCVNIFPLTFSFRMVLGHCGNVSMNNMGYC